MKPHVLILGAGHAGDAAAAALRQQGWKGSIRIVGDEPVLPYDRPPLSKAFLSGESDASKILLRPSGFYEAQDIELVRGIRAVGINRATQAVALNDGSAQSYDHLVVATGSRHRTLEVPGAQHPGVHQLRTLEDAKKLKAAVQPGMRLGIVGGGYIGLEVAASMLSLGVTPIIVEREKRLLSRVASAEFSKFLHDMHVAKGTEIRLETDIEALCPVTGIHLKDGSMLACDQILVGIGAHANDELARSAGIECRDGVLVDEQCRTSDPNIFAIGDCSRRAVAGYGAALRLESIPSAQEQAKTVAACITGRPGPPTAVPWFWSDQFDTRIQIAGLLVDVEHSFVRGTRDAGSFAIFHLDAARRVRAVEAVNSAAEFTIGKSLIRAGAHFPAELEQIPLAHLKKVLLSGGHQTSQGHSR